jgi:ABC-type dipeptide/oligopeptide/nickel transport system permease subunit
MSERSAQPPHVEQPPPSVAAGGEPQVAVQADESLELVYDTGLELKARSQWGYALRRFLRHRLAMGSFVVLIFLGVVALFPDFFAPYAFDEPDFFSLTIPPTTEGNHFFGTDYLGRDSLSRVIYGLRTSLWVALVVALLATLIGTAVGAVSGYFGGWVDNLLMRLTDLVLTLPGLAVLLTLSKFWGAEGDNPLRVALILSLLFWVGFARIVRGTFLSLREKEFVEAAKASGAGDGRIIVRHILPNTVGPIIVNATLIVAAAILTEAALSFLGFGVQPPNPALGVLINEGQSEGLKFWWLVTFPGLVIVLIALCINFIGDGLRDALDPTQRRVRA